MRRSFPVLLLLPLLFAACGDDGGDDGEEGSSKDDSSPSSSLNADEQAVSDALVASLLDPSCDLLTDDYLLELSFAAETVEEACTERTNLWTQPQYDEDDVVISDIAISGDKATAVVGSDLINITTTYELTLVDGRWLVSCDDFTCDGLGEDPSAEVS